MEGVPQQGGGSRRGFQTEGEHFKCLIPTLDACQSTQEWIIAPKQRNIARRACPRPISGLPSEFGICLLQMNTTGFWTWGIKLLLLLKSKRNHSSPETYWGRGIWKTSFNLGQLQVTLSSLQSLGHECVYVCECVAGGRVCICDICY